MVSHRVKDHGVIVSTTQVEGSVSSDAGQRTLQVGKRSVRQKQGVSKDTRRVPVLNYRYCALTNVTTSPA